MAENTNDSMFVSEPSAPEVATEEVAPPVATEKVLGVKAFITDHGVIVYSGEGVLETQKLVSHEDFFESIRNAMQKKVSVQSEKFLFPPGVVQFEQFPNEVRIVTYNPEKIIQAKFSRGESYRPSVHTIPLPNIVIAFRLKRNSNGFSLSESHFYATDMSFGEIQGLEHFEYGGRNRLWKLPLPNVFGDGRLCFGNNSMPNIFPENDFRQLGWYYKFLEETPFNSDLSIPDVPDWHNARDWINKLETFKTFPYHMLHRFSAR